MNKQNKWYSVFIKSNCTDGWEKVAEIASPGLTEIMLPKFKKIYGSDNVKVVSGKTDKA